MHVAKTIHIVSYYHLFASVGPPPKVLGGRGGKQAPLAPVSYPYIYVSILLSWLLQPT